jgi:MFS family permease
VTQRKWLSYENGLMLLLGLTFGLAFFDRNAVAFLTPFLVKDLALTYEQVGLLGAGLALTWALSAYILGSWSDRSGKRKPFLITIVLIFSACSILSGLAHSFLVLLVARVIMGIAEGPFLPICLAMMVVESSPNRRGVNAGILQTVFSALLGSAVAPVVLVAIASHYDWRTAFFLAGAPGLLCALMIWLWIREPPAAAAQQAADPNVGSDAASGPGLWAMLQVRNIALCCGICFAMVAWMLITQGFLPLYLTTMRGYSPQDMGGVMSALGFSAATFAFVAPWISDRIGRRPVLVVVCLISMLCPLGAMLYQGPLLGLAVIMFVGWMGAGGFALFMGVVPAETLGYGRAATSMGLVVCIGELSGGFIAPWVAGRIADMTSLRAPIYIAAGCALLGGILALFLQETAPAVLQKMRTDKA